MIQRYFRIWEQNTMPKYQAKPLKYWGNAKGLRMNSYLTHSIDLHEILW
jgi:hypothetical protein